MKKKIKIKNEFIFPIDVLAISTQLNDYQLAWRINSLINIELSRKETQFIKNKVKTDNFDIILYGYKNEEGNYYYLIKNRYDGIDIIPKLTNIDYLLIIEEEKADLDLILKNISAIKSIMGIFKIKMNQSQENYLKKLLLK